MSKRPEPSASGTRFSGEVNPSATSFRPTPDLASAARARPADPHSIRKPTRTTRPKPGLFRKSDLVRTARILSVFSRSTRVEVARRSSAARERKSRRGRLRAGLQAGGGAGGLSDWRVTDDRGLRLGMQGHQLEIFGRAGDERGRGTVQFALLVLDQQAEEGQGEGKQPNPRLDAGEESDRHDLGRRDRRQDQQRGQRPFHLELTTESAPALAQFLGDGDQSQAGPEVAADLEVEITPAGIEPELKAMLFKFFGDGRQEAVALDVTFRPEGEPVGQFDRVGWLGGFGGISGQTDFGRGLETVTVTVQAELPASKRRFWSRPLVAAFAGGQFGLDRGGDA